MREQLDLERSVAETVSPGSDWVEIGAERKHIVSYLGDFLFAPQRVDSPVKMLSGGERNRLLLARLFARPANVLVLDEPTNDLDIDSLELLESTLQEYGGTVLLVSHDRAFLDNVVTQTLAPEGGGAWREYVGGYRDWLEQRPAARTADAAAGDGTRAPRVDKASRVATTGSSDPAPRVRTAKLSYKETRELEQLPAQIEALEAEQRELTVRMSGGDYHKHGAAQIKADRLRSEEIEATLASAYDRWAALDAKAVIAGR
jgi:ATP-binding cassette subfamily F protein uup